MTKDLYLPDGFNLITCDHIDSTNEEAKRLTQKGATHGTVVWAQTQGAGRGRRGRSWVSEPGNLFCSLIVKPERPLAEASQLSFVMAVSVADALCSIDVKTMRPIQCKWPNDILIGGRKVAGILLETVTGSQNKLDSVIAGVGINIEHFPESTEFPATSLHAEGIQDTTAASVLESVCAQLSKWYAVWETEGFQGIRAAWLEKAFGLGGPIHVRLPSATHSGVFEALDPTGALIINENGTRRHIAAGDVYFDEATLQNVV